jgi:molybdopterin converting factor small subunit
VRGDEDNEADGLFQRAADIMVTVRFFAMLRGLAGCDSRQYPVSAPMRLDELKAALKRDFPALAGVLDGRSILVSINQELAGRDAVVRDGDEVGLLPPFSGG